MIEQLLYSNHAGSLENKMAEEPHENEGIKLLEKCPKEQAGKFVHEILDSICDGRQPRYMNYGKVWTTTEWRTVTEAVTDLLKFFIRKGMTRNEISQELDKYSLNPDTKQILCSCLIPRQEDVKAALVDSTAGITNAYLKDFDWKVKMVLASDKIATIRKPVISVDFDIAHGRSVTKPITVEMSKEELKNLITSLEAANKMVIQLKG